MKSLRSRKFSINIVLFIIITLSVLVLAEVGIRLIGAVNDIDYRLYMTELKNPDRLPDGLFYMDNGLTRLLPNAQVLATTSDFSVIYKTNSHGLRDKEYTYNRSDKIRVLAFGDSTTFGEGIPYGKRFTDIPENEFQNVEILNFGVPGYGVDQQLMLFAREGIKYSPDYVIIFINIVDVIRSVPDMIVNGSVVDLGKSADTIYMSKDDDFFNDSRNIIFKNSYFLSYLDYNLQLLLLGNHLENHDKSFWESISNDKKKKFSLSEKEIEDKRKRIKERTKVILEKFSEICEENDIKLIVVKMDHYGSLDVIEDIDGIVYYDLTFLMYQESLKRSLSFKYDLHYNVKTHEFLGNVLNEMFDRVLNFT